MELDQSPGSAIKPNPCHSLHIPPAPQQPTPDGEFECGVCSKTYSRRDLRDRHRRRCIKNIGQERQSKRKSCETCAKKKLRCSMTRPACSRCMKMGDSCLYPPSAIPVSLPQSGDSHLSPESVSGASLHSSTSPAPSPIDGSQGDLPIDPAQIPVSSSFDAILTPPWSPFESNVDPMVGPFIDGALAPNIHVLPLRSLSWSDPFFPLVDPLGHNRHAVVSLGYEASKASPVILLPEMENSTEIPSENLNVPDSLSLQAEWPETPNDSFADNVTPLSGNEFPCFQRFDSETPAQLVFAGDFFPKKGRLALYEIQALDQELFGLLREYPRLTLLQDFCSPFIHHGLYRSSSGKMMEPMEIALTCVTHDAEPLEANYGFVDRMIDQEREKLVCNFHRYLQSPETCLAALHAICIYQILGLFGDSPVSTFMRQADDWKECHVQRRENRAQQAELHGPFLLKITRHLYESHRDLLQTQHENERRWDRWKFAETLRRNIFLVNVINILGARVSKRTGHYFEPLDDSMILKLPLPAPECMWFACSEGEWLAAREQTLRPSQIPRGPASVPVNSLWALLQLENANCLDMCTLPPLTRVILTCTSICELGTYPL